MGGERPDGWTELTPEQATPADELEVAQAAADTAVIPGKNYPLVIRAGSSDAPVLVAIDDSGNLTYGEDYNPDEAARIFWEAMVNQMPPAFRTE